MKNIIVAIVAFTLSLVAAVEEFSVAIVDALQTEIITVAPEFNPEAAIVIGVPSHNIASDPIGASRRLDPRIVSTSKRSN